MHFFSRFDKQLFSQLLVGFNGNNDINIDKLTNMLEDNRDLLNDITNRECSKEGAAQLPKLLFDLVSHANDRPHDAEEGVAEPEPGCSSMDEGAYGGCEFNGKPKITSAQEIIHNLPKVWKVLIELLNHQKTKQVDLNVRCSAYFEQICIL